MTAERVDAAAADTPIAITALTEEFVENFGMTGPEYIALFVPSYSRDQFDVTLRGVGRNFRSLGGDPGVATYYNGIYSEDAMIAATENALFDVQRIEVLRGPQGTLYGRNAIGGVVNYITNPPTPEFESETSYTGTRTRPPARLTLRARSDLPTRASPLANASAHLGVLARTCECRSGR